MIFNRKIEEKRSYDVNEWNDIYSTENGYDNAPYSLEMKESCYFSCIKIISESIAKCTLQIKQETKKGERTATDHYLSDLLRLRPNPYMSAVDCFKSFVALAKHEGIAALYIDKVGTKVKGLYPVKINGITVDDAGLIRGTASNKILYDYIGIESEYGSAFDKDLIILRDFTLDGINAKATRTIMKESIDSSLKSQSYLNNLFTNGLTNRIVVQLTSDVKEEKDLKKIQSKFSRIYSNSGKIFTVPAGYNVSPLNLSLADAQFEQLRKLSKEEIAMGMQVPLSKLGIVRDTAISEEQDNIKFLTDCLMVIFTGIEQEMNWKLLTPAERREGYKIKFNEKTMLRMDALTQAEVISKYVSNGIYDLDFAKDLVGVERIGGDKIITLPSGQILLKDLIDGNASYQKGGSKDGGNPPTS